MVVNIITAVLETLMVTKTILLFDRCLLRLCRLKFECRGYRVPALIELTFSKRDNTIKNRCMMNQLPISPMGEGGKGDKAGYGSKEYRICIIRWEVRESL